MRSNRRMFTGILAFLIFLASATALIKRQEIYDWWRLRNYQPSSLIIQLATDTAMNDATRRLFYVHHPQLKDRTNFSDSCPDKGEKTIILGCYITHRAIYLFDVDDPRLSGIEQVTAAHETLHAAYDRLNNSERQRINTLLYSAYDNVKNDRVRGTIGAYEQAGDDIANELHSILGTEIRELPPDLETYYARYFLDRKKIVAYSEGYEKEFTSRENEAKELLRQMDNIEEQLTARRLAIDTQEERLNSQYQELERQRSTTQNPAEFNAKVSGYNSQIGRYRELIMEYNRLVEEHNSLLAKYNAVALEENELIKAIDSRSTSIPSE